jgi:hypothetical protein
MKDSRDEHTQIQQQRFVDFFEDRSTLTSSKSVTGIQADADSIMVLDLVYDLFELGKIATDRVSLINNRNRQTVMHYSSPACRLSNDVRQC